MFYFARCMNVTFNSQNKIYTRYFLSYIIILSEKNTNMASKIKGQSQISPKVNIHTKLHRFLISSLSSCCADKHDTLTPTEQ